MFKLTRVVAAAVVASAVLAAPAMASDTVILDGKERPASTMMAYKGKVNVVQAEAGKPALAFTKRSAFKAYLRTHLGVNLDSKKQRPVAKAAWTGDYGVFYEHNDGYGGNARIDSGTGLTDFHHIGFLGFWDFGDKISSVRTYGRAAILFSETNYRGDSYYVGPNQHHNIAPWFNDRASSAWVYW